MELKKDIFNNLFIFEMANNHMGSVEHGLEIIRRIKDVCRNFQFNFGFKFQYRDIDTFIHPEFKKRLDIKYVRRFSETRLGREQFKILKDEARRLGFILACTPFDEASVDLLQKHDFDIIKIGSCSATDWPLLEKVVKIDEPVIVSVAGLSLEYIDRIASFLEHREKKFALMHCVAKYPTPDKDLQLNQIDLLKSRYPRVSIGYSTHESPDNFSAVKIAAGKGAVVFEKHVGLESGSFKLNAYSATPEQVKHWLKAAQEAFEMCGACAKRTSFTQEEAGTLKMLRRGVFAKKPVKKGERIELSNTFLAIPASPGQITANDMSKYRQFYAKEDLASGEPVFLSGVTLIDNREKIYCIVQKVKDVLRKSGVLVPGELEFEISHHYGVDEFERYGCVIINFVNREYCKKIIVMLAGQEHPEQHHKLKEETFHVLYGDLQLDLDGLLSEHKPGAVVTVERNKKHKFSSKSGAVVEEISSTHHPGDSYYTDEKVRKGKHRKTLITYWLD